MRKRTSAADSTPIRVVIVTLDAHLEGAVERARVALQGDLPGLQLCFHVAAEWGSDEAALDRCRADIERGDIVIAHMLFMDDHIDAVYPWLEKRREECDAMIGCMSAEKVAKLTRMGSFRMETSEHGLLAKLKGLRKRGKEKTAGAKQMAALRRIPQLLRFIPGTAQDVRAYFLTMQYWLAGSDENVANMVRYLVGRYAAGPRSGLRGRASSLKPRDYPEVGIYHPRIRGSFSTDLKALPRKKKNQVGTVGLLVMRSYVLAGNTDHYDGVIKAFEAKGLRVIPVFASGLDARPAVEKFFVNNGVPCIDALVSLTGFSLVGGPAYNDADAAQELLGRLDVPYVSAHAVEFQTLEQWEKSSSGLMPIESMMMVAIPELDGATGPIVFGGRSDQTTADGASREMRSHPERAATLAARVSRLVSLRRSERAKRRVAITLFSFPPNAGNIGTAMHLSVFASLYHLLRSMEAQGYDVEVPESVDALRSHILDGNASLHGAPANVHERIAVDDHVRRETWLEEIEAQWGPAPGRELTDGASLFVLGAQFGNVFVGVQPGLGYEGDPMRLLFEKSFAPTHAFAAFYRYLREDFGADALLHFGTHGALEFMPGMQVGLTGACWPERLIGDLPNFYLYAANNPSEATIAKRRGGATLVSYLTPPIAHAGLYRGLLDLRASLDRWRAESDGDTSERDALAALIHSQAVELDLATESPVFTRDDDAKILALAGEILELEQTLIPHGLHVVGEAAGPEERVDLLQAITESSSEGALPREVIEALVAGESPAKALAKAPGRPTQRADLARLTSLAETDRLLAQDHEVPGLLHALDGAFVSPAPGGDLLRTPSLLPTGRNVHGFDPFRMPSAFAVQQGARQADRLLERHRDEGHALPESIAMVMWGTDNLKSEGGAIAQALWLMGARPKFDSYGRLSGASLIPLEELGRPRIDVVMTLSGIFRDLFPLQTKLLAEASYLAATADEPSERNFVRKHSLAHCEEHGCDIETASLRVFGNANGAYGANVSHMVQNELWSEGDELANAYSSRKSFAYGRSGEPVRHTELLESVLSRVELAYQNLDSVEVGVTTVDVYFDNLGGISRAIEQAGGETVPVYIGDETRGEGRVRTLGEQVALETRTRVLNPKWYEGMLEHGYEGVRQIEEHVTNTLGWSATTGQVQEWVYRQLATTYLLDDEMRERMAALNPTASVRVANRILEAQERAYWNPDPDMLEALRGAGAELEDRLEGIDSGVAA